MARRKLDAAEHALAVGLAAIGGAALVALRLRHGQPQALPRRMYGSRSVHAVPDRQEPRDLPARPEVHLHFHGVTAEDVAAIMRQHHDR